MKERPILFSSEMIRAILDGRKTQTRRVIKPQPKNCKEAFPQGTNNPWFFPDSYYCDEDHKIGDYIHCPYGQPGDDLWVRETFYQDTVDNQLISVYGKRPPIDDLAYSGFDFKTIPSIHMKRKYSRIQLRVKDVRVERIKDISGADAINEGIQCVVEGGDITDFADLWNSINAKRGYGWDVNPWVWVICFERIKP